MSLYSTVTIFCPKMILWFLKIKKKRNTVTICFPQPKIVWHCGISHTFLGLSCVIQMLKLLTIKLEKILPAFLKEALRREGTNIDILLLPTHSARYLCETQANKLFEGYKRETSSHSIPVILPQWSNPKPPMSQRAHQAGSRWCSWPFLAYQFLEINQWPTLFIDLTA